MRRRRLVWPGSFGPLQRSSDCDTLICILSIQSRLIVINVWTYLQSSLRWIRRRKNSRQKAPSKGCVLEIIFSDGLVYRRADQWGANPLHFEAKSFSEYP